MTDSPDVYANALVPLSEAVMALELVAQEGRSYVSAAVGALRRMAQGPSGSLPPRVKVSVLRGEDWRHTLDDGTVSFDPPDLEWPPSFPVPRVGDEVVVQGHNQYVRVVSFVPQPDEDEGDDPDTFVPYVYVVLGRPR